jgi:hypothetical protein
MAHFTVQMSTIVSKRSVGTSSVYWLYWHELENFSERNVFMQQRLESDIKFIFFGTLVVLVSFIAICGC